MRYSVLALAPFVAAAYGQETSSSATPTVTSTYTYSNTETNFLSSTNSYGVITGMPSLTDTGAPVAATSQPAVDTDVGAAASIPAGLPTGIQTIYHGGSNTSTSFFLVSVGSSTTVVVQSSTSSASATGGSAGSGSGATGASGSAGQSASGTGSASASSSSSAADAVKIVSGAVLGLGAAVVVALL
ncbi:hypothetical protein DOTSEDRAFT_68752 [Dothistroma septosporum NZE10]|uniref:Uncharacterized protein n=1 Tax=Dothistroma septosporum (strain NZE10 / CBS 128990) TaxID=675120 RepID=N1Q2M0_DOTSN|nr:hypothetical protein DOTSEDRAFT_68752 [Dothistroma septosporum NZE10]